METGRMNAATEADRELLWALLRRRAEELPTVALGAVARDVRRAGVDHGPAVGRRPDTPGRGTTARGRRAAGAGRAGRRGGGGARALADILVGVRRVPMPTFGPGTW